MKRSLFYFLPALICAACMLEGCRKNELQEEPGPPPEIYVRTPKVYPGEGGAFSLLFSIENPHKGDELQATTEASWITGITVGSSDVSFKVSKNVDETSGRTAEILLTYGNAEPAKIVVKQQEFIPAVIEVPETVTLDAFDLKGSFTYSIRNPREGAQLKATSGSSSITDVTVSGSDVAPKAGDLIENAVYYRPSTSAIGRILSIMTKVVEWCSMILVVVIIGLRVILKVIQGLTLKAVHLALPSICLELRIIPVKRFMFIWKMKEKQTLVHYVNE